MKYIYEVRNTYIWVLIGDSPIYKYTSKPEENQYFAAFKSMLSLALPDIVPSFFSQLHICILPPIVPLFTKYCTFFKQNTAYSLHKIHFTQKYCIFVSSNSSTYTLFTQNTAFSLHKVLHNLYTKIHFSQNTAYLHPPIVPPSSSLHKILHILCTKYCIFFRPNTAYSLHKIQFTFYTKILHICILQ